MDQVAKLVGFSKNTISNWIKQDRCREYFESGEKSGNPPSGYDNYLAIVRHNSYRKAVADEVMKRRQELLNSRDELNALKHEKKMEKIALQRIAVIEAEKDAIYDIHHQFVAALDLLEKIRATQPTARTLQKHATSLGITIEDIQEACTLTKTPWSSLLMDAPSLSE